MRTVNLKEEVKKARIAQEEANANLQKVIDAVEYQVKADQQLLHALKTMQKPLDILMDDNNDFEEKAKSFESLKEYFLILREIMELTWEHQNDYGPKYDNYDDSMCKLLNLGIANAVDEKSAEKDSLSYFETPEELYDTLKNDSGNIKFINEL